MKTKQKEQLPVLQQNESLQRAILVDVDGTLAINDGYRSPFEWSKVGGDKVNQPVRRLVNIMSKSHTVIVLSGRDSLCRQETEEWLRMNNICYHLLYMRPINDTRKDSIVKRELFESFIKDRYFVEFVLDDRNQVVDLWRKEVGLPCFQVNYGDF